MQARTGWSAGVFFRHQRRRQTLWSIMLGRKGLLFQGRSSRGGGVWTLSFTFSHVPTRAPSSPTAWIRRCDRMEFGRIRGFSDLLELSDWVCVFLFSLFVRPG